MTAQRVAADRTLLQVSVPGDKSLTHRALILSALAEGRSRVRAPLAGADTASTAACLRLLGCDIPAIAAGEVLIDGRGLRGLVGSESVLDCGNSGTTARLLMGVLAGHPFLSSLTGDTSLCSRPMGRVTQPLSAMGARFEPLREVDRLPLRVHGGVLTPLAHVSPVASAQVKSAVLLAGLTAGVAVAVTEPVLSRDHTERMLARLGVQLRQTALHDGGVRVELNPPERLLPLDFDVPGDFSSAAFVIATACLRPRGAVLVRNVGVNPTRTGFLRVLERMGGAVRLENVREACGEPVADIRVEPAQLRGVRVTGQEIPSLIDEIPVIAALAARAEGTTVIEGAKELRVKESDRIAAMVMNLRTIGVDAEELVDGLVVHGTGKPLAGTVRTLHDHRIAMAFGVLMDERGSIRVDEPGVVQVSFPGFWAVLKQVHHA